MQAEVVRKPFQLLLVSVLREYLALEMKVRHGVHPKIMALQSVSSECVQSMQAVTSGQLLQ